MEQKITVGQKLFRLLPNNKIKEVEVTSMSRKFFYVDNEITYPINLCTLIYTNKNYPQFDFQLYLTREEIEKGISKKDLIQLMRKSFDYFSNTEKFTLEQLQEACKVLNLK